MWIFGSGLEVRREEGFWGKDLIWSRQGDAFWFTYNSGTEQDAIILNCEILTGGDQ